MENNRRPFWAKLNITVWLLMFCIFVWQYPKNSSEWAAWAQVFGVLLAIYFSNRASLDQSKSAIDSINTAQRLSDESKKSAVYVLGEAALLRSVRIKAVFSQDDPRPHVHSVYSDTTVPSIVNAISAAPIHELRSREAILALLDISDMFSILGLHIKRYLDGPMRIPEIAESLNKYPEDSELHLKQFNAADTGLKCNVLNQIKHIEERFDTLRKSLVETSFNVS